MGFGFNLFFCIILVPLTGVLLLVWLFSREAIIGKMLGCLWIGIFGFIIFISSINWMFSKTVLDKWDYHGTYVINRDYFKGEQTDWQYNHMRFEITKQDSILFYVTDHAQILKTYRGTISTTLERYSSARLKIHMEQPTSHVLVGNPTTYRSAWDFYLVFNSVKFHNVFFKKGKWKPI